VVAVAARNGLWANSEKTPFGHGRPYSRGQLAELLREAELEPSGWTRALYVPPVPWLAGWAEGFEQVGSRLWPGFSGVLLMEAVKQTFAVKPRGARARVPPGRRVLAPGAAPASRTPVSQRLGGEAPVSAAPRGRGPAPLLEAGAESLSLNSNSAVGGHNGGAAP
jgi:hypothetical protein